MTSRDRRSRDGWLRQAVRGVARAATVAGGIIVLVIGTATLAGLAARWHWMFELATHFTLQSTIGAAVALALLALARRWIWTLAAGGVLLLNAAALAPLVWPTLPVKANDRPTYCLLSANLQAGNRDLTQFVELVRARRPDVFFVMEVDQDALKQLVPLFDAYPHRIIEPRRGAFGCGLFSRRPIEPQRDARARHEALPTLAAIIDFDGNDVTLVAAHPPPPVSSRMAALRDHQLRIAAELAGRAPRPTILAGDLNTTSWSPAFHDLLAGSGLRDSRAGLGPQPSWPNLPWLVRIPIDHVLVSDDVQVVSRELGPDIGSDHLPVLVEFSLGP